MSKRAVIDSRLLKMTPFARYRTGYIDGYTGLDIRLPHDGDYMAGFEEGKTDDRMGIDSKYDLEEDR